MKIRLVSLMACTGLVIAACGGGGGPNNTSTTSSSPSSAPSSAAPTDFVDFINQQIGTAPAFGSATPAVTTSLTSDFEFGYGFTTISFGAGSALPAGTFSAAAACTAAGAAACNPGVSADLNSPLN